MECTLATATENTRALTSSLFDSIKRLMRLIKGYGQCVLRFASVKENYPERLHAECRVLHHLYYCASESSPNSIHAVAQKLSTVQLLTPK